MSAEHRKPLAAFVLLAFVAALVVGVQRADAETGFLASVMGSTTRVQGVLPELSAASSLSEGELRRLGPAFGAVLIHEREVSERSDASSGASPAAETDETSSPEVPGRSSREHASRGTSVRGVRHGFSMARETLGRGHMRRTALVNGSFEPGAKGRADVGARHGARAPGRESRSAFHGRTNGQAHRLGRTRGHHRAAAEPGARGRLGHRRAGAHGWRR